MTITLTKEQFRMLLKMSIVADDVYGILGDSVSDEYKKESDEIHAFRTYILEHAADFGCAEFVEKCEGEVIPTDAFSDEMQIVTDDYDDEAFWYELETRLGKRDFHRSMTPAEKAELKKTDWYPKRIHDLYEKYGTEFEQHGIARLEIVEKNGK